MNAPASRVAADPLGMLLPGRSEEEMKLRRRLFVAREIAGSRIITLRSGHGLALNWMLMESAMAWTYAPASIELLTDRVHYCLRLAMLTSAAESLEGE